MWNSNEGVTSFGFWVKKRRKELDQTQEVLAENTACSVETIKKIEAGTLRPSRLLAERLADSLEVPLLEKGAFVHWARTSTQPALKPVAEVAATQVEKVASPATLPMPPTPLIGREKEVKLATAFLLQPEIRLLTLTGPGGTGKTRLSIQVARELLSHFVDGVFFVPLAAIREVALLIPTIAANFELHETARHTLMESLQDFLNDKQILLLLDNFEQILQAASLVSELLTSCPNLKVLVTSRAGLQVRGEQEFSVPPLTLPEHSLPSGEIAKFEAVRLFVARAQAVRPDFTLNEQNTQVVADICQRLDGLPLALELAAARVKVLPPAALLTRLNTRLTLLTGGSKDLPARQRTLRDTIGWSYDLLEKEAQLLFRRMAIFAGGCTLEAAEAVFTYRSPEDNQAKSLDTLETLVNSNLVRQQEQSDGTPRYTFLETIREFALERLEESGEAEALKAWHLDWYRQLAQNILATRAELSERNWLAQFEIEHDNFRAALEYSLGRASEIQKSFSLINLLQKFWVKQGHFSEGLNWAKKALATPNAANFRAERAGTLFVAGDLYARIGDQLNSLHYIQQSMELYQQLNDRTHAVRVKGFLSGLIIEQGDLEKAWEMLLECEKEARSLQAFGLLKWTLYDLGTIAQRQGRHAESRRYFEEAITLVRQSGKTYDIAGMLATMSSAYSLKGDFEIARRYGEESLELAKKLDEKPLIEKALHYLGFTEYRAGDYQKAAQYFAEYASMIRQRGDKRTLAWSLNHLADVMRIMSNYEEAFSSYQESLTLFQRLNDGNGMAAVYHNMGYLALNLNEVKQAANNFRESLRLFGELGYSWCIADALVGMAGVLNLEGRTAESVQLLGFAQALHDSIDPSGALLDPANRLAQNKVEANIRQSLPSPGFELHLSEGKRLTLEEATSLANKVR